MLKLRNMRTEDVEAVARMAALDYNIDAEKGYSEAKEHTIDHLQITPEHCYVVEKDGQVVAAMVLHPQEKVFEVEDFHVTEILQNKEAYHLLKAKLREQVEKVNEDIICCPCSFRRLIATD